MHQVAKILELQLASASVLPMNIERHGGGIQSQDADIYLREGRILQLLEEKQRKAGCQCCRKVGRHGVRKLNYSRLFPLSAKIPVVLAHGRY